MQDDKTLQDEVLRQLGRNLLLFQQIECSLKFLLSAHKVSGTSGDYLTRREERAETIKKQMLGNLVEKYGKEVLQDVGADVPEEDHPDPDPRWMSVSFHIACDPDLLESLRRDLKFMTNERNQLVHSFLPRWQPDSGDKMNEALRYLDEQREKTLPVHQHLLGAINGIQETRKRMREFVDSGEFDQQLELKWLQASLLVRFLEEAAGKIQRKDGWTYLAHAGKLANEQLPDEIRQIKDRYGVKTLKRLLVASEVFDVLDEVLTCGSFRTIYRVKSGTV